MSSQAGISPCRAVSFASAGTTPSSFCRSSISSRSASQPWSKGPLALSTHSFGSWGGGRRPRGEVHEEGLVGHERLLLARPLDRLVGHVLGEVVALLGRLLRLYRRRAFVDRWVVLIRLTADEAVEVFESTAGRPGLERPHRAGLPDRHLVALAELRRRIAVQLQGLSQGRTRVGADRA